MWCILRKQVVPHLGTAHKARPMVCGALGQHSLVATCCSLQGCATTGARGGILHWLVGDSEPLKEVAQQGFCGIVGCTKLGSQPRVQPLPVGRGGEDKDKDKDNKDPKKKRGGGKYKAGGGGNKKKRCSSRKKRSRFGSVTSNTSAFDSRCSTSVSDSDSDDYVVSVASMRRMIKFEMGQIRFELKSESSLVSGTKAAGPATDLSTAASESILRLQLEQVVMVMCDEQPEDTLVGSRLWKRARLPRHSIDREYRRVTGAPMSDEIYDNWKAQLPFELQEMDKKQ